MNGVPTPPIPPTPPTPTTHGALPYGPATASIRRFMARLAAISSADRLIICQAYEKASELPRWSQVERRLAAIIERSGRQAEQEAVAGPLLQLVRLEAGASSGMQGEAEVLSETASEAADDDPLKNLDPVAEPALAAVLALLVRDLLQPSDFELLIGPVVQVISLEEID